MNWSRSGLLFVCVAPWAVASLHAAERPSLRGDVTFSSVAPILKRSCASCHGPETQMAGLDLSTPEGVQKGGVSGPVFVKGHPEKSLIVQRLKGLGGKTQMPMGFRPLDAKTIGTVEEWIAQGASFGAGQARGQHWAYVAPVRPASPSVSNAAWVRNPIDAFVLAKLDASGLAPSPVADKATLVRRVYLDLVGMPPTIEEMEAYLRDTAPGAYERLVDRLQSSPHYGEQQAVGWLDLARYADSNGYEKDARRTMWPYRDWVIEAFNRNLPYDEFTIEQIAGDMLPNPTISQLVASGFNRNTMLNEEGGVDPMEQRWLTLVDRVGTTSTVWLGSTIGCAQCHDHKYDPFTNDEFYEFLAFFDNCDEPTISVQDPVTQERVRRLGERIAELEKVLPQLKQDSDAFRIAQRSLGEIRAEANALNSMTTLVMREKDSYPPTTFVRIKGTFLSPGKSVAADTPASLPPLRGERKDRLALARWLVSRENPLTARVFVNRVWQQFFGLGIVKTSGDFGTQCDPPSHPELLDWLAVEFMESGWDMKHVVRLIVTSNTYRQSSVASAALRQRDPENRLLARGPRFRLSAETLRDNALVAAGLLSEKMGGPSVFPDQPDGIWKLPYNGDTWVLSEGADKFRRGVYTFWRRSAPYPAFVNFDAMSREGCTVRRVQTNTPLQALTTMNDAAFMRAARGLAQRMMEASPRFEARIETGFRRCVVRRPTEEEARVVRALFEKQLAHYATDEEAAKKLVQRDAPYVKDATIADCAAMTMVANVLLNLDETITKE